MSRTILIDALEIYAVIKEQAEFSFVKRRIRSPKRFVSASVLTYHAAMAFSSAFEWISYEALRMSELPESMPGRAPLLRRQDSSESRQDHGDRVLLPSECLQRLMSHFPDALPSPLTFQLTCKGAKSYCGVQEFTAPAGKIVVPKSIIDSLGASFSAWLGEAA